MPRKVDLQSVFNNLNIEDRVFFRGKHGVIIDKEKNPLEVKIYLSDGGKIAVVGNAIIEIELLPFQDDYDINKPSYYNWLPGIECKEVTRHFNYNKGCAIKYIWRAGRKADEIEDLKKAINYLQDEIKRVEEDK